MEILWTFLSGIFSGIWPEVATLGWHRMGWTFIQTLLTVLIASGAVLLVSYVLLSGIFWKSSKALSKRINNSSYQSGGVMQFLLEQYEGWENTKRKIGEKIGKKIVGYLDKYKYLFLFSLNLIPFVPLLTTFTIVAGRLAKVKYSIIPIFLGSAIKLFIWAWTVYAI